MAKGKHAALAANRRAESAHQVIDRLTTELAEAKMRARDAEARAAKLEGVDSLLSSVLAERDEVLGELEAKLRWWATVAKADKRRRMAAIREVDKVFIRDVARNVPTGPADFMQFTLKRWPSLCRALLATDDLPDPDGPLPQAGPLAPVERKLPADRLRVLQRASSERTVWAGDISRDMADVLIDLLDAKQAEFTPDEVLEFIGSGA